MRWVSTSTGHEGAIRDRFDAEPRRSRVSQARCGIGSYIDFTTLEVRIRLGDQMPGAAYFQTLPWGFEQIPVFFQILLD